MNAFDLNRHQKTGVGCGGGERSRGIKEGFSKIEDEGICLQMGVTDRVRELDHAEGAKSLMMKKGLDLKPRGCFGLW